MNIHHISHTRHTGVGSLVGLSARPVRWILAALLSVAVVAGLVTPAQAAGNRDWLRPGCDWDVHGHWIQKCWVWSNAHQRNMPVLVLPAKYGGDGGLWLLDGLEAPKDDNYWARTPAMDTFIDDNVTLVMPGGGGGQFYADWAMPGQAISSGVSTEGSGQILPVEVHLWETFLTGELPHWLHQHFGVNPHRNSIVGISMGALPALTLAARHKDQFVQTTALSGFIDPRVFSSLLYVVMVQLTASLFGGGQVWELYGSSGFSSNMEKMDPVASIPALHGLDVMIYAGDGTLPPGDHYPGPTAVVQSIVGERLIRIATDSFVDKARRQGVPLEYYPSRGLHTWEPWVRFLAEHKHRYLEKVG
ncbi:alpha/beta hydrolase [Corynebacterium choanae]|uniref:Diacylglycerol acyltransferase/mycolyltransferase Ag85C n=1 Tax=Corynebacterium choanae TaxID=1862358 RepID=A0A3G6J3E5_9CORY|nr:alpha/beta hydrolase family protein [Corynebacterium choanae]AZA12449.1 Diacylglycerol acyltransferase/mycolyltransferase Ag85C precursor [Corynebacterium choanae]